MSDLKKSRLNKLNQALMEREVPPSSIRRARKRRADRGEPEPRPAAEKDRIVFY